MVKIQTENFDLEQICQSGQCFRMNRQERQSLTDGRESRLQENIGQFEIKKQEAKKQLDNSQLQDLEYVYHVIAGQRYLEIMQQGREYQFCCSQEEFDSFWKGYFDLEQDYASYISQINPKDIYLLSAAKFGSGIRILRQEFWEMIVSFLISQQNNIPRIRRCIENICEAYGEKRISEQGKEYYGFPRPEVLAELEEDALMACNLGYRSKYVVRTAKMVVSGKIDLDKVKQMSYKKAKEELMKLFGVGEKVADCICLYSLHHLEAFPIDTHIRWVLENHYKKGFPMERYQGFQGVLQQYIFYYDLFRH